MNNLKAFKKISTLAGAAFLASMITTSSAFAGWSVSGSQVLDPNGSTFVFRGVNHAHTWYQDRLSQSLKDIAATGANSVRVVLSNGTQWSRNGGSDVSNVISQCKANKLVCVLEVHDSTGYGESAAATHISRATEYWLSSDIKAAITGQEDYVIVNIANEPFGNTTSASAYTADTITAIKALRSGGLTHLLMVDAANWGQDWTNAMRDNATSIFAADSLKNTVFSVHMYEVYGSASIVQSYLNSFQTAGLALVVGEFGGEHGGKDVAEEAILQYAQDKGIGYLGWSWSGNGSCCVQLDIVNNWNPASLSTWGNYLINSTNGIKATSKLATNFGGAASSSSVKSSSSSSIRSSSSSSVVVSSSSSVRSSSSVVSSSSVASSSSSVSGGEQCNWYGTLYPLCTTNSSGWGYENNKSCIARSTCTTQPAPYGVVGSATSSSVKSSSSSSVVTTSSSSKSSVASSASSSTGTSGISCSYVVTNSWTGGYQGAIRVTNKGSSAINGWTATWQYTGANRLTSSWNATVSGSNPYSAISLSWNGNLGAGQTVEFGVQGNTNGGTVETPAVSCK